MIPAIPQNNVAISTAILKSYLKILRLTGARIDIELATNERSDLEQEGQRIGEVRPSVR